MDKNLARQAFEDYSFEVVDKLFGEYAGDLSALSTLEQEVVRIWRLEADMYNGGFMQFFCNWGYENFQLTCQTLKKIGANKSLDIIERAEQIISVVKDDKRIAVLWDIPKYLESLDFDKLNALDELYWKDPDDIQCLAYKHYVESLQLNYPLTGTMQPIYEGKAKQIFATPDENVYLVKYKNSATAFNGEKKAEIEGKGALNNQITSLIFQQLATQGIASHFIEQLSPTEQLVQKVSIIPLEVVVRNVVAGSLAKRLGIEEGTTLQVPVVEFYYKDDALGDPLVTEDHIHILGVASAAQLTELRAKALEINQYLVPLFAQIGVRLVDFKLEFGVDSDGNILLADEISPDTCRLWDAKSNAKLDKDLFRRDLGNLTDAYQEILNRLRGN